MTFCDTRPIVVKVGGSLYTLPGLGIRLNSFLMTLPNRNVLLMPGGGCFADAVGQTEGSGPAVDSSSSACIMPNFFIL